MNVQRYEEDELIGIIQMSSFPLALPPFFSLYLSISLPPFSISLSLFVCVCVRVCVCVCVDVCVKQTKTTDFNNSKHAITQDISSSQSSSVS